MSDEVKKAKAREASRRWRAKNPDKVKANNSARDPEKVLAATKSWQQRNPERAAEISRQWKLNNPATRLWFACKRRAEEYGLAFDLTVEGLEVLLEPMKCSVTGLQLIDGVKVEGVRANPWAPSVDKIKPSNGYVQGNVRIVCWAFNQMRGDFPDEVVLQLAKAVIDNFEVVEGEE